MSTFPSSPSTSTPLSSLTSPSPSQSLLSPSPLSLSTPAASPTYPAPGTCNADFPNGAPAAPAPPPGDGTYVSATPPKDPSAECGCKRVVTPPDKDDHSLGANAWRASAVVSAPLRGLLGMYGPVWGDGDCESEANEMPHIENNEYEPTPVEGQTIEMTVP